MDRLTKRIISAAFTGHRAIPSEKKELLRAVLRDTLIRLITVERFQYFASGGALGFDTLAAQTVLALRREYPITLFMVIPCADQSSRWSKEDQAVYQGLLDAADFVRYTSVRTYFDGCMLRRNQYLVDHAGLIVAYQTHGNSGTAQTVRYAKRSGVPICNLADDPAIT